MNSCRCSQILTGFLSLTLVLLAACGKSNLATTVNHRALDTAAVQSEPPSSTTTTTASQATPQTATDSSASQTTTTLEPSVVKPPVAAAGAPAVPVKQDSSGSKFDPSLLAPGTKKEDFNDEGIITPTVYYKPIIVDDTACDESTRVVMSGEKGRPLGKVCPKTLAACSLQGSCTIVQRGEAVSYNFIEQIKGVDHFFMDDMEQCPFGLGVSSICLDPFYTVAADLSFYKPGDVIFIPALVGQDLPGGKKHTGFFVVRDQGGGISGKGRFDFFSGFYDWRDSKNPLTKARLTDTSTKLNFYRVTGASAKQILRLRSFPGLPSVKR